jgi:hypothetical protein
VGEGREEEEGERGWDGEEHGGWGYLFSVSGLFEVRNDDVAI